ncbi:PBP1A family penicillin-binding protein [Pelistega sp. NLN82]|uniref:Penicillin-binding protein 1A n=1 Tax=Pelistega ratti TaxID=2652177 RepID=A0A6L9Y5P6_9BURK|nr:PBP1A family penicillin-binding protein [Pelistega ratti]NEN75586.1 PBP1A family penicillin-binding protein [Pelistega ratti]
MNTKTPKKQQSSIFSRFILKPLVFLCGIGVCLLLLGILAIRLTWSSLPDLKAMTEYRPRLPLYIYSADKVLLAEYGDERRNVLNLQEIPLVMRHAILAAEDDSFYTHGGVDWAGVGRAALVNLTSGAKAQGASTITMQLARNFYLSSDKKFTRKFYELLLTYKIEEKLSKDQILELYMNQIYLGHRSYGFAAAARRYFGKPLSEISIAEAAALAGIPKSPSRVNPITNLDATINRQHYVLNRMLALKFITQEQYEQAKAEKLIVQSTKKDDKEARTARHGQYVAELARQLMYTQYGDSLYGRGLKVYTTVRSDEQQAAYEAVRQGLLTYTRRKPYTGPAEQLDLPEGMENDRSKMIAFLQAMQEKHPDSDDILAVVVLSASKDKVVVMRSPDEVIELTGTSLNNAKRSLVDKVSPSRKIKRGSVIYIEKLNNQWSIINLPLVQAALIALNPQDGAIKAMIGGFDFYLGDFNRVTQAWRQPGSTFKPFVYASGLERGLTPETQISDRPFVLPAKYAGGKAWTPKNYGNSYVDSLTLRQGLYKSKNMVSIRILEAVGPDYAANFIERLGFDMKRQPPKGAYLTMALGAGNVTPLQMASAYAVFANGGYRVNPYIIDYVEDINIQEGSRATVMKANPLKAGDEKNRVIDARTAYVMNDLLRGVARSGTAASASKALGRSDIAGKTGTTNRSVDAWFAGYTPKLVAVTWLGFDQPTSLGDRETGGGAAMPIWINFMRKALKDIPVTPQGKMPEGLSKVGDNFYYKEFPAGKAIRTVGTAGVGSSSPSTGGQAKVFELNTSSDDIGNLIKTLNSSQSPSPSGPPVRF